MNPHTGELYASAQEARAAGVTDPVELTGTPEAIQRVSDAVAAQHRRTKRKMARTSRRANR
jgi:hypothetical protein